MKTNLTQEQICDSIIESAQWWKSSNDITSPTHLNDLEDCLFAELEGTITDEDRDELYEKISELYWFIRKYDKK